MTRRLTLHPMTVEEAERVVAGTAGAGDRWADGYPHAWDVVGARGLLDRCAQGVSPRPFGNFEIRRNEDGLAVGGLGFDGPPAPDGSVTIGYALIPSVRGHGYASEALRGLLAHARACGVTLVRGDADLGNVASQHVMAAAGMRAVSADERVRYYEIGWPRNDHRTADADADADADEPDADAPA